MPIDASVGKHHSGATQCYNLPKDQLRVANLLDLVPRIQGGTEGTLLLSLDKIRWGIVDDRLYRAIQVYQRKQFGSTDGHVDPNQRTIHKLEETAFATDPTKPPAGGTPLPNQPQFNVPAPDDLPKTESPISNWFSFSLDFVSTGLTFASEIVAEVVGSLLAVMLLDIIGFAISFLSAILSLPFAWAAADRLARFNGVCSGFWNAMQDMADPFQDDALDSLITISVSPAGDIVPMQPGNTTPVVWPPIPTPSPHISALDENKITESERVNRAGEREGCQKAVDYIMGLERSPKLMTWTQKGHHFKTTATGKVMLRLLCKASKGKGVAGLIREQINAEQRKSGQQEWPAH
jgi:hypothetical protein